MQTRPFFLTGQGASLIGKSVFEIMDLISSNSFALVPRIGQIASNLSKGPHHLLSTLISGPRYEQEADILHMLEAKELITYDESKSVRPIQPLIDTRLVDDTILERVSNLISSVDTAKESSTKEMMMDLISQLHHKFSSHDAEEIPQPLGSILILLLLLDNRGQLSPLSLFSSEKSSLAQRLAHNYERDSTWCKQELDNEHPIPKKVPTSKKGKEEYILFTSRLANARDFSLLAPIFYDREEAKSAILSIMKSKNPEEYKNTLRNDVLLSLSYQVLNLISK